MKSIAWAIALALPLAAAAADSLECSIKASKRMSPAELTGLAKVKEVDARKTALASLKAPQAANTYGGLGVEDGCLVYAYDVVLPVKSDSDEVIIDAGTGQIITRKPESAAK